MHDADLWLEDRLRTALREEAESLSVTLTVAELERRLAERPRPILGRVPKGWAAALVLLLVGLTAAIGLSVRFAGPGDPTPSPSPRASSIPRLPTTSALLADVPAATLRLEGRRDPSAVGASPAPDDRYAVGNLTVQYPFVIAASCVGGERITVEVGDLEAGSGTYISSPLPCDGAIHTIPSSQSPLPGEVLDVTVLAPAATSWAVAVGEYPESYAQPPEFTAVQITPGWAQVVDMPTALASPVQGTGVAVSVPPAATRLAAWITCQGDAPATVTFGTGSVDVDCTTGATERLEVPVQPTDRMDVQARTDGLAWVRIVVEADASVAITYPSAPPLPANVAATTWAASGTDYLTVGTIGSNEPALIRMPEHQAGVARGGLVPVPTIGGEPRTARLELVSIATGSVVRTLVESPFFIGEGWLDATHEQVIYALQSAETIEYRRIGLDGNDDRLLVTIPMGAADGDLQTLASKLAYDDEAFQVEWCRVTGTCTRTVVDTATGEATTTDTSTSPMCTISGIIDGQVVGASQPGCASDGIPGGSVVVAPLDGGAGRPLDGAESGVVVPTASGPKLVFAAEPRADGSQQVIATDLATGEAAVILEQPAGSSSFVTPLPVRLPSGYVLLGTSLSDDPGGRGFIIRAVPILVNLDTGERLDLVNLPHTLAIAP